MPPPPSGLPPPGGMPPPGGNMPPSLPPPGGNAAFFTPNTGGPNMNPNLGPGVPMGGNPDYGNSGGMGGQSPANTGISSYGSFGFGGSNNNLNTSGKDNSGGGVVTGDSAPGSNSSSLPLINELDLSIQCNPSFLQASVGKIVISQNAANSSKIPLGMYKNCGN